jgi:methylenetetrahydrofolate dehydrogenase (NADP+)/methenyltetrahydrofolate cyclohydrolase
LSAVILDGRKVAAEIKLELGQQVAKLATKPGLGTVLVGEDPGSVSYVAGKHRDCAEVGMQSIRVDLPATASESDVLAAIRDLNSTNEVTGYIVQLPLPKQINTRKILESIDPAKDADGLHPFNLGKLVMNVSGEFDAPLPCTPAGIVELLRRYKVNLKGANVAVIGRGLTVGRPLGLLLSSKAVDATVTLLHSASEDIAEQIREADVVVAAVGIAGFVKAEWIRPGAAVLDVGVSREGDQLLGDVDRAAMDVAGYFSPNPGGVGPMTRAMLMTNVVKLATKIF